MPTSRPTSTCYAAAYIACNHSIFADETSAGATITGVLSRSGRNDGTDQMPLLLLQPVHRLVQRVFRPAEHVPAVDGRTVGQRRGYPELRRNLAPFAFVLLFMAGIGIAVAQTGGETVATRTFA